MGGGLEPYHEHDWHVTVRVEAAELDALETVMDFHELERQLAEVCAEFEGKNLNDIPPFAHTDDLTAMRNPSAERVTERIAELLNLSLYKTDSTETLRRGVRLLEVRVTEAPGCLAIWWATNAENLVPPAPPTVVCL